MPPHWMHAVNCARHTPLLLLYAHHNLLHTCCFTLICTLQFEKQLSRLSRDNHHEGHRSVSNRGGHEYRQRSPSPKRKRSPSPERSTARTKYTHSPKEDSSNSANRKAYAACAVCLGRHKHNILECKAETTWSGSYPTVSKRVDKELLLQSNSAPLCVDWQLSRGCHIACHYNRHLCSGCTSSSHGAQRCPRAQKLPSAHSL